MTQQQNNLFQIRRVYSDREVVSAFKQFERMIINNPIFAHSKIPQGYKTPCLIHYFADGSIKGDNTIIFTQVFLN